MQRTVTAYRDVALSNACQTESWGSLGGDRGIALRGGRPRNMHRVTSP